MSERRKSETADDDRDDDDDEFNVVSGDDDDAVPYELFADGGDCSICGNEPGRIGIDPTVRGAYEGDPVLVGYACAAEQLKAAYDGVEGVGVIVEPFGEHSSHLYYRLDEMPAYQFVREDVEAMSWLMLTIGDECKRCGEQSRFALLTKDFVDQDLPENAQVFRNLDREIEHLCSGCAATHLVRSYEALQVPLVTADVPRGAMGILMPAGE
ncbi:MAG: hypothetical protein WEB52_16210 [Dehalococcoidia bacterium]